MKKVFMLPLMIMTGLIIGCTQQANQKPTQEENIQPPPAQSQVELPNKDSGSVQPQKPTQEQEKEQEPEQANTIVYKNTEYGFTFTLPKSWQGYQIIDDKWVGEPIGDQSQGKTGPMLLIRHPEWKKENPRQDIPIMIFTLQQWEALQQEKFHIGAAPIGPKELGRNSKYVFALPARYNFAFPTGYEEVEKIIESQPLKPME